MKPELTKFNLICEEIILEAKKSFFESFSKKWFFEDELDAILPFILKKCELAFTNFYEQGKPGKPEIISEPEIEPVDEGTQNPGFKISYYLDTNYVKNDLLPCLLADKNSHFSKLNKKYNIHTEDTKLVLILNAEVNKNINLDLAKVTKDNSKIPKFSIATWEGNLYLNFDCEGVERDQSNVKVGTIKADVDVKEYKPLASKIWDFLMDGGKNINFDTFSDNIGDGIAGIFGKTSVKDNKVDKIKGKSLIGNIGKVPGCEIKCVVKMNKDLKKNIELDARNNDYEYHNIVNNDELSDAEIRQIIKTPDFTIDTEKIKNSIGFDTFFNNILHYNSTDNIELFDTEITGNGWIPIKYDGPLNFTDLNGSVNKNDDYACAFIWQRFLPKEVSSWEKHYNLYININDWKKSGRNKKDNYRLLNKNTIIPLMQIEIWDENQNVIYTAWYDWTVFSKVESAAYNVFKQRILALKPDI